MKTTRYAKANTCLVCGYIIDSATEAIGKGPPDPGDVGVCFKCGHVMIYVGAAGELREPTAEESAEIAADWRMQDLLEHHRQWRAKNPL